MSQQIIRNKNPMLEVKDKHLFSFSKKKKKKKDKQLFIPMAVRLELLRRKLDIPFRLELNPL